jgi:hypothetical protein
MVNIALSAPMRLSPKGSSSVWPHGMVGLCFRRYFWAQTGYAMVWMAFVSSAWSLMKALDLIDS